MRARRVGNAIISESLEVAGEKLNCLAFLTMARRTAAHIISPLMDSPSTHTWLPTDHEKTGICIFSILVHCA